VQRWSKRCGVTVYRWANVGNHAHFAIRIGRVHQWSKFIRGLTGAIARKLQVKGLKPPGPLWESRPFTRVVRSWRRAFKALLEYIELNQLEALGFFTRQDRPVEEDAEASGRTSHKSTDQVTKDPVLLLRALRELLLLDKFGDGADRTKVSLSRFRIFNLDVEFVFDGHDDL